MKTQEIDGKTYIATTNGDGSITLTPQEAPKQEREHRAGDVWVNDEASLIYVAGRELGSWVYTARGGSILRCTSRIGTTKFAFNIFDMLDGEYVRKQDVVDALSFEDSVGDTVLRGYTTNAWGIDPSRKALSKLGINANT